MKILAYFFLAGYLLSSCFVSKFSTSSFEINKDSSSIFIGQHAFNSVSKDLYAMINEVSNEQYQIFLDYCKKNGTYNEHKPDLGKFENGLSADFVFGDSYFNSKKYNKYPVVGISYTSAQAYIRWLQDCFDSAAQKSNMELNLEFKLPSKEEFLQAYTFGHKSKNLFPWGTQSLSNSLGCPLANFKYLNDWAIINDDTNTNLYKIIDPAKLPEKLANNYFWYVSQKSGKIGPAPVYSFMPNPAGIYNLAGNVSEMIEKEGCSVGGNWNSLGGFLNFKLLEEFNCNFVKSPFVGFRVFIKVKGVK